MKSTDLLNRLDKADQAGVWLFSHQQLATLLRETGDTLKKTLGRATRSGVINSVTPGLYLNPRAKSLSSDPLVDVATHLRPWDFNYLSLETVLSESGWISQIPARLTLMTTGREGTFATSLGDIEFVHTKRRPDSMRAELTWDERRRIFVAPPARAYKDLRRVGRNKELVNSEGDRT